MQVLAPHLVDDLGEEGNHDEHEGDEVEEEIEPVQAEHAARIQVWVVRLDCPAAGAWKVHPHYVHSITLAIVITASVAFSSTIYSSTVNNTCCLMYLQPLTKPSCNKQAVSLVVIFAAALRRLGASIHQPTLIYTQRDCVHGALMMHSDCGRGRMQREGMANAPSEMPEWFS